MTRLALMLALDGRIGLALATLPTMDEALAPVLIWVKPLKEPVSARKGAAE